MEGRNRKFAGLSLEESASDSLDNDGIQHTHSFNDIFKELW